MRSNREKKKKSTLKTILTVISTIIFLAGIALIGYAFINYKLEAKSAKDALDNFDAAKEQLDGNNGSDKSDLLDEKVYCKLTFSDLKTSTIIFKGSDEVTLKRGSGWMEESKKLGEKGFCVMMGHRDTSMNFIQDIQVGEIIKAETLTEEFTYKVIKIDIMNPDDVLNGEDLEKPQLRLITCYPFSYFGSAPDRFVITCDLVK